MRKCGYGLNRAIGVIKCKKRDAFFWKVNFMESLERFSQKEDT
jgi:hypothetical protein